MMDEHQRQPEGMQADAQLVATVTAAVLQTLQSTGNLPQNDGPSRQEQQPKTIDLIGLFVAILEKFWLIVICAVLGAMLMGWMAGRSSTTCTLWTSAPVPSTSTTCSWAPS